MRRLTTITGVVAVLLALSACGGGGQAATAKEGDAFCKLAEKADSAGNDVNDALFSGDAADIEDAMKDALKAGKAAAAKAPKDIKATVDEVVANQEKFIELFEDLDFDIDAAGNDSEMVALIEDEDALAATDDLDEYLADNCGIAIDGDSSSDTQPDSSGPIVIGSSGEAANAFIDLYELGSGEQITDEQRACLIEEWSDIPDEEFENAATGGQSTEEFTMALGLGFINCGIAAPN